MAWKRPSLGHVSLLQFENCRRVARTLESDRVKILRRITHAKDVKVLQPALVDIHQPVISVRVCRNQEESALENEIARIADNALDHLIIVEVDAHP